VFGGGTFPPEAGAPAAWLGKVAQVLATPSAAPGKTPDWVADVDASSSAASTVPAVLAAEAGSFRSAPSPPLPFPPRLILGGASSRGIVRERNGDRFRASLWHWNDADATHEVALLIVADGMGGYQAGDEASSLTVRTVAAHLDPVIAAAIAGRVPDGPSLAASLGQAIREANRVVQQHSCKEGRCKGMGATLAAVLVLDGQSYFGHVGDCRVYLCRGTDLKQLTEDQTLVARMVALGQLTPEEAASHEARNEVTQAVGKRPDVTPSAGTQALERGDYLVVACDGLAAHVEGGALRQVLSSPVVPPQHLAGLLVRMADEAGGSDNCTVVVAHLA
jgi:protein phosphatase